MVKTYKAPELAPHFSDEEIIEDEKALGIGYNTMRERPPGCSDDYDVSFDGLFYIARPFAEHPSGRLTYKFGVTYKHPAYRMADLDLVLVHLQGDEIRRKNGARGRSPKYKGILEQAFKELLTNAGIRDASNDGRKRSQENPQQRWSTELFHWDDAAQQSFYALARGSAYAAKFLEIAAVINKDLSDPSSPSGHAQWSQSVAEWAASPKL